jgi:hypothetical protein
MEPKRILQPCEQLAFDIGQTALALEAAERLQGPGAREVVQALARLLLSMQEDYVRSCLPIVRR